MENSKKIDKLVVVANKTGESNVYAVHLETENGVYLKHPLCPKVFIYEDKTELDKVPVVQKSSMERCLDFALSQQNLLDFHANLELKIMSLSFVVTKKWSNRQKKFLSMICGDIAKIHLQNSVYLALKIINDNSALLDDFNKYWYEHERYAPIFAGKTQFKTDREKGTIFNMAGFILAQI
jgi:hypothetical protein